MHELLREIERAVRSRGWSARQASIEAVGSPDLITNMRRGRVPSVDRVQALCEVLGLEFYVGPSRDEVPVDEERLALALTTAERGLESAGQGLEPAAKARLVIAVYALVGRGGATNAERVRALIRAARGDAEPEGSSVRPSDEQ